MRRALGADDIAEELKGLAQLDRAALVARWEALYGRAPPPRTSQGLLIRAVAYKIQERVFGSLSPSTRRALAGQASAPSPTQSREARPGTVLLREWHGVTHQVSVIDKGVVFRGKLYRSLSEVARLITGARWSGPTFFGLKAKRPGPAP